MGPLLLALAIHAAAPPARSCAPDCGDLPHKFYGPVANCAFGHAVAIEGNVAVVTAPQADPPIGCVGTVYVFRFDGETWSLEASLAPTRAFPGQQFGLDVDIEGDLIIVGATAAAFIYRQRSTATWVEEAVLGGPGGISFGSAVAIAGDLALVGAPNQQVPGPTDGVVYCFRHDSGTWVQDTTLLAWAPTAKEDDFGFAVALDGDLAVIGAPPVFPIPGFHHGAAYFFRREKGGWSQEFKVEVEPGIPSDEVQLGYAVAVDDEVVVMSDPASQRVIAGGGYVFVYEKVAGVWSLTGEVAPGDLDFGDRFGESVSINGATVAVGMPLGNHPFAMEAGSTYVFRREGPQWVQAAKLWDAERVQYEGMGRSVAVAGQAVLVGIPGEMVGGVRPGAAVVYRLDAGFADCNSNGLPDSCDSDCNGNAAPDECDIDAGQSADSNRNSIPDECETLPACVPPPTAEIVSPDPASVPAFGGALDLDGARLLVASAVPWQNPALLFGWTGRTWEQQATLTVAGAQHFGTSVALDGDLAAIGERLPFDDAGAVHLFREGDGGWALDATISVPSAWHDVPIDLSGDRLVIGADAERQGMAGQVHVFRRVEAGWLEEAVISEACSGSGGSFGTVVAIGGPRVAAWRHCGLENTVHVYQLVPDSSPPWRLQQVIRLDATASELSLDPSGALLLAGLPYADAIVNVENSGLASVFRLVDGTWILEAQLTASDPWPDDEFGASVATDGSTVIVGVPGDDDYGVHSGSAYVFRRDEAGWHEAAKLRANGTTMLDRFGYDVAICGPLVVAGAPYHDGPTPKAGAVYFFLDPACASPCPADINADGVVDVEDLIALIVGWGSPGGPADVNGDGVVDAGDIVELIIRWGPCAAAVTGAP